MRVIILTSSRRGVASRVLPALCADGAIQVVGVIHAEGVSPNRKRFYVRKLKKIFRIGLLGALNGVRIRSWFADSDAPDLKGLCDHFNIPFMTSPYVNCEHTRNLFRELDGDLGLSLGNGFIPKSVFSIPRLGMVNIHTEILPDYQGGHSILWPIYDGKIETGFTIHQIDSKIDTGAILLQRRYPILFQEKLQDTVKKSLEPAKEQIPTAFVELCRNYEELRRGAISQAVGKSYTTPTLREFARMMRNNQILFFRQSQNGEGKEGREDRRYEERDSVRSHIVNSSDSTR